MQLRKRKREICKRENLKGSSLEFSALTYGCTGFLQENQKLQICKRSCRKFKN
jgi:hypothetical protein